MDDGGPRLKIAVLASRRAPGIEALLADPNRGSVWDLVGVIGSETTLHEAPAIEAAGVPLVLLPFARFHEERGLSPNNLLDRRQYDDELLSILGRLSADHVLVAGYRYLFTEPLLTAYERRMIALHDGDLTVESDGQRKYRGLHAVEDALLAGDGATRSTAYFVTPRLGEGPLLLLSAPYPAAPLAAAARACGDASMLFSYARLHREWMIRNAWGPMLVRVVELIAAGTLHVIGDVVWADGAPGPCRMGEAPSICHDPTSPVSSGIPASCPFIRM